MTINGNQAGEDEMASALAKLILECINNSSQVNEQTSNAVCKSLDALEGWHHIVVDLQGLSSNPQALATSLQQLFSDGTYVVLVIKDE